jgi:hypothetical protein
MQQQTEGQPVKRGRGRPKGSPNKQKKVNLTEKLLEGQEFSESNGTQGNGVKSRRRLKLDELDKFERDLFWVYKELQGKKGLLSYVKGDPKGAENFYKAFFRFTERTIDARVKALMPVGDGGPVINFVLKGLNAVAINASTPDTRNLAEATDEVRFSNLLPPAPEEEEPETPDDTEPAGT